VNDAEDVFVANATFGQNHVVRLTDLNADGDAMDSGEAVVYASVFALGLAFSDDGALFTTVSQRLVDLNADGDALDAGEDAIYGQPDGALGTPLSVAVDPVTGRILLQHRFVTPTEHALTELIDLDGDGNALGAGENPVFGTYSTSGSSTGIAFDSAGNLFANAQNAGIVRLVVESAGTIGVMPFTPAFESALRVHSGPCAP
jgi:hypothetical protein